MPEQPVITVDPVEPEALVTVLAETVLAVPEVVRLEPTIRNRLRQLSAAPVSTVARNPVVGTLTGGSLTGSGTVGTPVPDGISVRRLGDQLDVTVEVAVRPTRPASRVAAEIQDQVRAAVLRTGERPGTVNVSVLAVERSAPLVG